MSVRRGSTVIPTHGHASDFVVTDLFTAISTCVNKSDLGTRMHKVWQEIQIGKIQIGNDKIEKAVIGRMEWPFSATVRIEY